MHMEIRNNVWYTIPDFTGYEIKFINGFESFMVRSFKNFVKHPEGVLLQYEHKTPNGVCRYYEMTEYTGYRRRLKIEDIYKLLNDKSHLVYIRGENDTNIGSRLRTLPADRDNCKKNKSEIQCHSAGSLFKNLISQQ